MSQHLRIHSNWLGKIALVFMLLFSMAQPSAAQADAALGKKLFKTNCAACHKLDKDGIGPALAGITETRSEEWLIKWIRNNAELRASGDADAIAVYDEWNGVAMTAFEFLSEDDVRNILQYTIEGEPKKEKIDTPDVVVEKDNTLPVLLVLGAFMILFWVLLIRVQNTLRQVQGDEPTNLLKDANWLIRVLAANKRFMTALTVILTLAFLYGVFTWMMSLGVEQDYKPSQPINFSHKIHAGDNKIDCNYCHSSARHSRNSGIPSANVCMNCHMAIDGSEILADNGELKYGGERSPEIAKIYNAIGWDPDARKYIEDYEQKPIEWIRIHNLPDLAYFNHSQHVTAGKIECQTCHGPVETMDTLYQYSELTMGWCINCHRDTKVQTANGYYSEEVSEGSQSLNDRLYERYHDGSITVDKIGGMECGKCHY